MTRPSSARARRAFAPTVLAALATAALLLGVAPTEALAQPKDAPPKPDATAEADYTQHMKNGIQLYELKHYGPAVIEFEAAYTAKPSASPLINEALCYREQMKYPQAVAALKKALALHGGTLDAVNKAAAEKAIDEMSPLIAIVELHVDPTDAVVKLDDELVPAAQFGEIAVGPNAHTLVVSREGHEPFSTEFTIASGQRKTITISLESRMGVLEVFAPKDDVEIQVDGSVVGRGHWSGPVEKGNHAVLFAGEKDAVSVTSIAKQTVVLDRRAPVSNPETPPKPPPKVDPPKPPPEPMGFYIFVQGGLLYPTALPQAFVRPDGVSDPTFIEATNNAGAVGGFRAGYRINTYAAFEGSFDYSNVTGGRTAPSGAKKDPAEYSFSSWRIGPLLRLMSPGRIARFVGAVGGGLAFHTVSFTNVDGDAACVDDSDPPVPLCADGWGVDFFVTADAGVEFNIGRAILGLRLEVTVDGTKGVNDYYDETKWVDAQGKALDVGNPFDNDPVVFVGPVAHFGYSQW